ncbi:MAG: ABC transporter permease [Acidimicrobiia bacterium]
MNEHVVVLGLMAAVASGTPLVFASVGEILCERSGVLNLGVNGMMLVGAVTGFWAAGETGSVWMGVAVALLVGAVVSVGHAVAAVGLRVNQIVSGLALAIFGDGLSTFIGRAVSPPLVGQPPRATFRPFLPDALREVPVVGPLIFGHDPLVYLSWGLVAGSSYYLLRTRPGLAVRAVGEDPASADAAGLRVDLIRYWHVVAGGGLAGVAGAYFSLALVPSWQDGITAGAGWIAIALVVFAAWRPWRALVAAYLFGGVTRLNFTFQTLGVGVPADILAMLPFLLTIVVLVVATAGPRGRFLGAPAALAAPYAREER